MVIHWSMTAAVIVGALLSGPSLRDQEQKVAFETLPAAVKDAVNRAVPNAKWESISKETEDGQTIYTFEGKDAKDREVETEITEDGKVLEVETKIAWSEVPVVVRYALAVWLPTFVVEEVESVAADEGKVVGYSFEGEASGMNIEVLVSADGKRVEIEVEDEEEEDEPNDS